MEFEESGLPDTPAIRKAVDLTQEEEARFKVFYRAAKLLADAEEKVPEIVIVLALMAQDLEALRDNPDLCGPSPDGERIAEAFETFHDKLMEANGEDDISELLWEQPVEHRIFFLAALTCGMQTLNDDNIEKLTDDWEFKNAQLVFKQAESFHDVFADIGYPSLLQTFDREKDTLGARVAVAEKWHRRLKFEDIGLPDTELMRAAFHAGYDKAADEIAQREKPFYQTENQRFLEMTNCANRLFTAEDDVAPEIIAALLVMDNAEKIADTDDIAVKFPETYKVMQEFAGINDRMMSAEDEDDLLRIAAELSDDAKLLVQVGLLHGMEDFCAKSIEEVVDNIEMEEEILEAFQEILPKDGLAKYPRLSASFNATMQETRLRVQAAKDASKHDRRDYSVRGFT